MASQKRGVKSIRVFTPPHWLDVDGILVYTTLTEDDLRDPMLWTMRSPRTWALSIATTNPAERTEPRAAHQENASSRGPRGGGPEHFNRKFTARRPRNVSRGSRQDRGGPGDGPADQ